MIPMYLQFEESGLIAGTQEWEEREKEKRSGLREQDTEQMRIINSSAL